ALEALDEATKLEGPMLKGTGWLNALRVGHLGSQGRGPGVVGRTLGTRGFGAVNRETGIAGNTAARRVLAGASAADLRKRGASHIACRRQRERWLTGRSKLSTRPRHDDQRERKTGVNAARRPCIRAPASPGGQGPRTVAGHASPKGRG